MHLSACSAFLFFLEQAGYPQFLWTSSVSVFVITLHTQTAFEEPMDTFFSPEYNKIFLIIASLRWSDMVSLVASYSFFGFLFGVSGSVLLMRKDSPSSKWGWPLFLASNFCWIAFAVTTGEVWLLLQTLCFTYTSSVGIKTWIIDPARS